MVRASKKKQVVVEHDVVEPVIAAPMVAPVDAVAELIAAPIVAPIVASIAASIAAPDTISAETTTKSESKRPTLTSIHATLVQHSTQLESTIEKILTENVIKMEERLSAHTAEVINLLHETNRMVASTIAPEENQTIYPKDDLLEPTAENQTIYPTEPAADPQKDSEPEPAVEEAPSFFSYYQPFIVGFITGALASMFRTSIVLKRPFFL
uniref:Uncharacterized protein n=1 Tax=viral metagenome TaxID=1070528 RepID=A0A6C0IL84_9ZZZZ